MKNIEVEIGFDEAVEYGKVYAAKMGDRSESDVIKQAILDIYGATHVIASARATNMLIEVTKNMAILAARTEVGILRDKVEKIKAENPGASNEELAEKLKASLAATAGHA